MGYRAFNEKTTLSDARDSSEYTVEALGASEVRELSALAAPLDSLLTEQSAIETTQRQARRATIRANALVRTADGFADDEVREFVKDVLALVRQDRSHDVFVAFFPTAPSGVVELTLEPEVPEIERIQGVLKDNAGAASLRRVWTARWRRVVERGQAALAARKQAAAQTSAVGIDVQRWIERADRVRRKIDGALTQYAADHKLPRDFNDRFFPEAPAAKRRPKQDPASAPATAG